MRKPERSVIDRMRVMVWFDALSTALGMGPAELGNEFRDKFRRLMVTGTDEAQARDNRFYEYRDGSMLPEHDFNPDNLGSVLNFAELYAPGSLQWIFLPLFNLLDGPLRSSSTVRNKIRAQADERMLFMFDALGLSPMKVDGVVGYGKAKRKQRYRLPACFREGDTVNTQLSIQGVHRELLRLNEVTVQALFKLEGHYFFRKYDPVEQEIAALSVEISLNNLTASVGLALEAEYTNWSDRYGPLCHLIARQLPALEAYPPLKRVADELGKLLLYRFHEDRLLGYSKLDVLFAGLPESWVKASFEGLRSEFAQRNKTEARQSRK